MNNKSKSQTEITKVILNFLGDYKIEKPEDLIPLIKHIKNSLEFRPYIESTKDHADKIQWKRTASEILQDGYVYQEKACSDLVLILITLCKALSLEAQIAKLINLSKISTHSIAEIKINGDWYRIDPSMADPKVVKGLLTPDQTWNKDWQGGWKIWKRGSDLWDLGLDGVEREKTINKS